MLEQESLLTEIEFIPQIASVGKRFLNYLIDVVMYYILTVCFTVLLIIIDPKNGDYSVVLFFALIFIIMLYYFLCEFFLKGRTVGKLLTGTKVVNEDGTVPSGKTSLLRTLARLIPFEPFTAFGGRPLHDKLTRTYVVDIKKTRLNDVNQF